MGIEKQEGNVTRPSTLFSPPSKKGTVVDMQPGRILLDDGSALLSVVLKDVVMPIEIKKGEGGREGGRKGRRTSWP